MGDNLRVLLDINIFSSFEDYSGICVKLNELSRRLNPKSILLKHPKSIEYLDTLDENTKRILPSNLAFCAFLDNYPSPMNDLEFNTNVGYLKGTNNDLENHLLYAVYTNSVTYLITENQMIHQKSTKLGLKDRVLYLDEALDFFKEFYSIQKRQSLPQIKQRPIIQVSVDDPIFDSPREEYPEFNDWYNEKARLGRKCWCYFKESGKLGAVMIFNGEDFDVIKTDPILPEKRRFKICTFKIDQVGYKLGELLLKKAFDYCIDNSITETYLTHFAKSEFDYLVNLMTEYGFIDIGANENGETVFFKDLNPTPNQLMFCDYKEIFKKYYPLFYDGNRVKKLVVPIRPQYHEKLFTDYVKRTSITLNEYFGDFIIEGNTIKKAYISHSPIKNLKKGDILLFYRSEDHKELTSLGVLEEFKTNLTSPEEIMNIVGKRTVYSSGEIEDMVKKPASVMIFTMHLHLKSPISLNVLKENNILKGPPQTITEITHGAYEKIRDLGGINDNLTIH